MSILDMKLKNYLLKISVVILLWVLYETLEHLLASEWKYF